MNEYLEFAKEIAYYAGDMMKTYFYKPDKGIIFKKDRTPVTEADQKINNYLIKKVKEKYPNHGIDGEEEKQSNNNQYIWVCDPIDGTSMFTNHIPVAVFSLALVKDGKPIIGVVYDPFLDEIYTAIKGKGAFCNDKQIHVNTLEYGKLGSSIDYDFWNNAKYDVLKLIKELSKDFRTSSIGSVAHASMLVASGKISASIFPGTDHGHCDIAASKLIVEEAGGKVTDFYGNDQRYDQNIHGAILTNRVIHDKLIDIINKTFKED